MKFPVLIPALVLVTACGSSNTTNDLDERPDSIADGVTVVDASPMNEMDTETATGTNDDNVDSTTDTDTQNNVQAESTMPGETTEDNNVTTTTNQSQTTTELDVSIVNVKHFNLSDYTGSRFKHRLITWDVEGIDKDAVYHRIDSSLGDLRLLDVSTQSRIVHQFASDEEYAYTIDVLSIEGQLLASTTLDTADENAQALNQDVVDADKIFLGSVTRPRWVLDAPDAGEVSWSYTQADQLFEEYIVVSFEVAMNGVVLGETQGRTFYLSGLLPGQDNDISITPVDSLQGRGISQNVVIHPPTSLDGDLAPSSILSASATVAHLNASAFSLAEITLTWPEPDSATELAGYLVYSYGTQTVTNSFELRRPQFTKTNRFPFAMRAGSVPWGFYIVPINTLGQAAEPYQFTCQFKDVFVQDQSACL